MNINVVLCASISMLDLTLFKPVNCFCTFVCMLWVLFCCQYAEGVGLCIEPRLTLMCAAGVVDLSGIICLNELYRSFY